MRFHPLAQLLTSTLYDLSLADFLLSGIIGYGHIGSQLSVLAESMGMNVIYYDAITLMALGTSRQVPTLDHLLADADFVTLHVPDLPETRGMISTAQFEQMRTGSYLINASRGTVVDIPALVKAMRSGKIAGAALDVYPNEPAANGDYFTNNLNDWAEDLLSLSNIILTPHIGGSTEEAQRAIGVEGGYIVEPSFETEHFWLILFSPVADALVRYINQGITLGSVNLPEAQLRSLTLDEPNHARVSKLIAMSGQLIISIAFEDGPINNTRYLTGHLHSPQCSWCSSKG